MQSPEPKNAIVGEPTVSIIIPTYNEERNISRLLASIAAQVAVRCEVVVVDQCSSDRTVEIATGSGCRVLSVPKSRYYSPPGRNRNVGAAAATGTVLVHLDADMEFVNPVLLQRLTTLLDDTHQAAVIHEVDIAHGFWGKCKAVERRCYWNTDLEAARAVTKVLFEKVGGYHDEISSGEDSFVSRRYQRETNLVRDSSLVLFHHTAHASLRSLLKKKFAYGRTARRFLRIARESRMDPWWRVVWSYLQAYLANATLLLRDPLHFLGLFPLRLMEFGAICLGILAGGRSSSELPKRGAQVEPPGST